ncbi:sulfatase [Shewanella violacea DSS12]|uniref:Sulfatase n=2 Tax=Shewanella violacea TaxID=60217 RepID=D4ZJ71_SHEVD|nr:sulfatase [Shewanella violacea DSS12]
MGRDRVSRLVSWGHWFAFFNGFLAMIVGLRYLDTVGYPETWIGWGYLATSTLGHFSFLGFIVYLVLVFPVTLLLPYSKILRGYAASVATLSLCILLYDTIIYDDYGLHLSPFVFDLAWADLNALLRGTSYIITPLGILAIELTVANFLWKRIEKIHKARCGNKVVAFVGLCFISSHLIHIWADAADITEITRLDDAYPLSYPATARSFMESHGIDSSTQTKVSSSLRSNLNYPKQPLQCTKTNEVQPNILLLTIDSLRADMVNSKTMPFFSQYADNNQEFLHHISGGNQFNSGMFSILYGLQGSYINSSRLSQVSPLLTQVLKRQGYQLGLFSGEHSSQMPKAIYNDFEQVISAPNSSDAAQDIETIAGFQTWKQAQKSPWFGLINLRAPDSYDTPIGFMGIETVQSERKITPAQRVLFNQYRQSLYFIDQEIEKIITNLPTDTLVIITGVSGKLFTSSLDEARGDLSPANVQVPLVIHWPQSPAKDVNYRTSHYGIVPTLMTQVLGCTNPATDYSAGRSLLQPDAESWVYVGDNRIFGIYQKSEITVIDRHGKYRIYDENYQQRLRKKMSAPELIEVMRESRRMYNN